MVKFNKISLLCMVFTLLSGMASIAYGQQRTITGMVLDENGEGVIGAVIVVTGTNSATTSGVDGSFRLPAPSEAVNLTITHVSFDTRQVTVQPAAAEVTIAMASKTSVIDEVVVTAFSQQKRGTITSAISSVSGEAILASPVSNISNALVGNTPGITGLQTSGEPGHNSTDLKIRGVSTYGSSTPLIVIDGVEQASERAFDELNAMDPNEIASISVLKDAASTAVYGIRGANGVIIVATKRGVIGPPRINFSANFGLTQASELQKGTTSYEYALMRNEAINNEMRSYSGKEGYLARLYDEYDLWKFKNNRDFTPQEVDAMVRLSPEQKAQLKNSPALYYQSRDLYKEQFDKLAPQWGANFNISGGTTKVRYFASLGYFQQEGITTTTKYYDANTRSNYQRYNYRVNFDIEVVKNLKISVSSAGQFGQAQGPGSGNDPWDLGARYKTIMQYIYEANPFISPGIIDGKLISGFAGEGGSVQNPLAVKTDSKIGNQNAQLNLINAGMNTIYNSMLDNVVRIEHTMEYLTPGLRLRGTVSYQDNYNRRVTFTPSVPSYTAQRSLVDPNEIEFFGGSMSGNSFNSYGNDNWNKLYIDAGIDWDNTFNGHSLNALLLGKASRYTMPGDGNHIPSGVMGLVMRVSYNYENRYMVEFNAGYNGTEQFAEGNRFGFFPAVSAGWVLTEEKFFPKNDVLSFFKIRASYGEVGNDLLGNTGRRFLYLPSTYNYGSGGYWLGNVSGTASNPYFTGANEGQLGYPDITWERARKYDVGVELTMLNGKLHFEADWFREDRSDILTTLGTIPAIYGVSPGNVLPANVGKTTNRGYEIMVSWSDNIGRFRYKIEGDVSYSRNKIEYRAEARNPYYWMNATGFSIGQNFGYKSDGYYNTEEELANRPYHKFCGDQVTLGDIRYTDLNGDGIIDEKDVAPIGYPNFPQFIYNFRINLGWKNIDARILLTGTARGSYYLHTGYTIPFFKTAGNAWQWQYDGRWTPEKAANGDEITYPRATIDADGNHNNYVKSDFWIAKNDFFKIKNVELGYTFRGKSINARIFVSANNLHTFGAKRLKEVGIDPETKDGSAYIYPLTRVYNLGVNLQF